MDKEKIDESYETKKESDDGFSESQLDLDIEVRAGEWQKDMIPDEVWELIK